MNKTCLSLLLFCQFDYGSHFFHHFFIVFSSMGNQAAGAILDTLFGISKVAAALIPQRIEGAITEEAAEVFLISTPMAGKVFAGAILEEIVVCHCLTPLK